MSKILTRTLTAVLCVIMVLGAASSGSPYEVAEARTIFDIEDELKAYKSELANVQAELATITKNIAELEGKSGQTAELLVQYQAEIEALEAEIILRNGTMESYDLKRAQVISEIAIIREDYEYRMAMYKKLMQFIYENSDANSFELLFSSDNFSDFLTRRDHYNDIMNAANALLKEIEISISDLEANEIELAETQEKYNEYLVELNRAKLEMSKKKKEFETIAAELNLNSGELSEKYKEKNARLVEIKEKIKKLEEERKKYYSSTAKFIWPVKTSSYRVTSQYGWRGDPFGKPTTEYHKGIDIACSRGTPIIAVKDGVVTRASWNGGYGECIIIYHGDGISSLYAHLDNSGKNGSLPYKGNNGKPTYHVKAGDAVKAGQVIGYVGTTGRSTGYHLHFGVIDTKTYTSLGGNYVNPNDYLPDGYYTKKNPKK